ncbi:ATP-binding protein [Sporosarcina sp. resist]|uniref:AAA family ATPase n=1 Tax=Sporosarcina sp. resist TaxID=2762563 RepID=UPI00164DA1E0|nr:AAA family ATPase [Sporosarcina sp. resist]QNK89825.1 ATP-binding protein [Sporosarcina sp. resist]
MYFYNTGFGQVMSRPGVHLIRDNWNDFGYRTLFKMYFVDESKKQSEIGHVKIGTSTEEFSTNISTGIAKLNETHFSLGQGKDYYENLNRLGPDIRSSILVGMNDIANDLNIFDQVIQYEVTKSSLLRDIKVFTVKNQFHRIAKGGVPLTPYQFSYHYSYNDNEDSVVFEFQVEPDSMPPTNIHALIGSNGVGKTTILNGMIDSLLNGSGTYDEDGSIIEDEDKNNLFYDSLTLDSTDLFANMLFISFSAFDNTAHFRDRIDEEKGILYSYIGIKDSEITEQNEATNKDGSSEKYISKTPETLINEFLHSIKIIEETSDLRKIHEWRKAIEMLESDAIFKSFGLKEIDLKEIDELKQIFNELSSGHKIILLTITRLIEKVDEKSLVILDEPESHLHPPLLSAFIRALSNILISQNGVAIIATHSPVILQELPRSCISIIKRAGKNCSFYRPEIETFGENVGTLTREVFGLEVTYSGFHGLLEKLVEEGNNYEEILGKFNGELGIEARTILRSLLLYKE